ncbi:MAG: glycosyltransferase family 4 protein [Cyanobacteriota bacterium]|nr:glycosyltransferase family 4 protein [Cyanobacteriota bacterium]
MKYYLALNTTSDIESFVSKAKSAKCPGHVMWEVGQVLKAKIYQPINVEVSSQDRKLAKIIGFPECWALARQLSEQLNDNDVIYCDGEHLGIPIATVCSQKQKRPKIAVLFHNINRPKGYLALNLFKVSNSIDLFVTGTNSQTKFLHRYLNLPKHRIFQIPSHPSTDTSFFTPKPVSQKKVRPLIASGGLEKRDYKTLANATKDLNLDVKICAFSPNKTASKRTFPEIMPSNMYCGFYEWEDLLQLYCDADLVVLPLLDNNYQAGLSTLFEAMACRKPIIVTRSPKAGIINKLIDLGIVTGVNSGNSVELKQAIINLLNDPEQANKQAQLGHEFVCKYYNHGQYIQDLTTKLISTFGNIDNHQLLAKENIQNLQKISYK